MTEYINRADAITAVHLCHPYNSEDSIRNVPVADVAPVIHGEWKDTDNPGTVECSNCHVCESMWFSEFPYCPSCGAKMDVMEGK